jgi:uridine kinase
MTSPSTTQPKILTLALSGPSTSGKSTLSYLLHTLFSPSSPSPPILPTPPLHILADDYMLDDPFLPLSPSGRFPDAETTSSINMPELLKTLRYVQDASTNGGQAERLPEGFLSWQSLDFDALRRDAAALVGGDDVVRSLRQELEEGIGTDGLGVLRGGGVRLVILDGFLLYHDSTIRELCDLKILLRLSKSEAKKRRGVKKGYWGNRSPEDKDGMGDLVGLGDRFGVVDFWRREDYFEECVWKGWEGGVGWAFEEGDVEGVVREKAIQEGIVVGDLDLGPREQAEWVVRVVAEWLRGALREGGKG